LAEGGFGAVYKVSDSTRHYALKVEGIDVQVGSFLFILVIYSFF
jgi:hypothetical protein